MSRMLPLPCEDERNFTSVSCNESFQQGHPNYSREGKQHEPHHAMTEPLTFSYLSSEPELSIGNPSLDWVVFPTTTKTSLRGELHTDLLQVRWKKRPPDDGRSDL